MGEWSVTYLFSQQRGCCARQEGIPCAASRVPGELLVFPPGGGSEAGGDERSLAVLPCLSFWVLLSSAGWPQELLRLFCSNNLEQVTPVRLGGPRRAGMSPASQAVSRIPEVAPCSIWLTKRSRRTLENAALPRK